MLSAAICGCTSLGGGGVGSTPEKLVTVAVSAMHRGDAELAEAAVVKAVARYPDDGSVRLWAAQIAELRGDDSRSLSNLRAADRILGRSGLPRVELHRRIGALLFRAGRFEEAVHHLEQGRGGLDAELRGALIELLPSLPAERREPEFDPIELPLLDGALPMTLFTVGEKRRPFVLDTGATVTTISSTLAKDLGVDPILKAGVSVDGLGRSFPVSVGVLKSLALGPVDLGPQPVIVIDDDRLGLLQSAGAQFPNGLIGLDVISRFRMTIDPDRRSVVFAPRQSVKQSNSVGCLCFQGSLLAPVRIEGKKFWFTLDTGASHSSLTEAGLMALSGGATRAMAGFRRVLSPGGSEVSEKVVKRLSLNVSQTRFVGVDLPVVPREVSDMLPVHGVIGADLIGRCRATLDGGNLRLSL